MSVTKTACSVVLNVSKKTLASWGDLNCTAKSRTTISLSSWNSTLEDSEPHPFEEMLQALLESAREAVQQAHKQSDSEDLSQPH